MLNLVPGSPIPTPLMLLKVTVLQERLKLWRGLGRRVVGVCELK